MTQPGTSNEQARQVEALPSAPSQPESDSDSSSDSGVAGNAIPAEHKRVLGCRMITNAQTKRQNKQYFCKLCRAQKKVKEFNKLCNAKDHARIHTNECPFVCPFPGCDKAFPQKGNLSKHEKGHQVGSKRHTCTFPNCTRSFSEKQLLKVRHHHITNFL